MKRASKSAKQIVTTSEFDGREYREEEALDGAVNYAVRRLQVLMGTAGWDPQEVESVAIDLADLCAMLQREQARERSP